MLKYKMPTPLMMQYYEIKSRFQDCIILFHLGDFYEVWESDAEYVSQLLGLTLTKRGETQMCGVPVNHLDFYIRKLIKLTKRPIGICNQINTPEEAKLEGKSLVTRDVVKIYTRGTYSDIFSHDNNFILSIVPNGECYYLCYADFSCGECFLDEVADSALLSEIYKINPSEILIEQEISELNIFEDVITVFSIKSITTKDNRALELIQQYAIKNKFNINLESVKLNNQIFMKFGKNTIKNLEILLDSNGEEKYSLLSILNKTKTPEGRRILRHNIVRPLVNQSIIEQRLDCIDMFMVHITQSGEIKFPSGDLKKLVNNITNLKIMRKIGEMLRSGYEIINTLGELPIFLKNLQPENINIYKDILLHICENPGEIGEGINFQNSDEVIRLNQLKKSILTEMFSLPEKYNLNCRVKNNNLIGYFFEFTKGKAPEEWILKQGLSTSSRYTNPELINLEIKLKEIDENLKNIETILFNQMKDKILQKKKQIENFSSFLGYIDYFHSCSVVAINNKCYRPKFIQEKELTILQGRHPVLDNLNNIFVANDLILNQNKTEMLITGPNMGGKSTFLRQNAIIVLMAQIGMFVPAHVQMPIFDGLFVRIGSGDNISQHESTFMVEMKECSEILHMATENSLIILDEVGRGTSTNDGISICFAILEYIHDHLRCFSVISTHYHELSKCEEYLSKFQNYKVNFTIENDKIIFLYKIIPGIAESSFGIYVASYANLPKQVLERSKIIFKTMQLID